MDSGDAPHSHPRKVDSPIKLNKTDGQYMLMSGRLCHTSVTLD